MVYNEIDSLADGCAGLRISYDIAGSVHKKYKKIRQSVDCLDASGERGLVWHTRLTHLSRK